MKCNYLKEFINKIKSAVFKGLNKEILNIESDGQCIEEIDLYNNYNEIVEYTKTERNVLLYVGLMVILLFIFIEIAL